MQRSTMALGIAWGLKSVSMKPLLSLARHPNLSDVSNHCRYMVVFLTTLFMPSITMAADPVRRGVTTERADERLGELITIPAGSFLMGNSGDDKYGKPEEFPQHRVDLPTYQIGKYEVTRGQYRNSWKRAVTKTQSTGRRKAGNGKKASSSYTPA